MKICEDLKAMPLSIPLSLATAGTLLTGFVGKRFHMAFGSMLTVLSLVHGWQHYKKIQLDAKRMAESLVSRGKECVPAEPVSLQRLVTSLEIASFVPGRIRVRTPFFVGNEPLTDQMAEYVKSFRGIQTVETNTVTGSMLILYMPEEIQEVSGLKRLEEIAVSMAQ